MKSIKELIEEWRTSFNDDKEAVIIDLEQAQAYHEEQMKLLMRKDCEMLLQKDKEIEEGEMNLV